MRTRPTLTTVPLTTDGRVADGATAPGRHPDCGAQSLELSVAMPAVLALAMVVLAAGQVVLGLAATNQIAVLAARTAAVEHDDAVHELLVDAGVTAMSVDPPSGARRHGDPVTVTVTRPLRVLLIGRVLDVSASATFRTEEVP